MDLGVGGSGKKAVGSLGPIVASGIKWSVASQGVRQGMQFVTTAVLARLLSPSDYGLISMAMVVIEFQYLVRDLGTAKAVIRQRNLSEELLSSIFWVNVVFGFIAMLVIIAGAPLVATFYGEARLTPILEVLSLTFLISGISILQQAILERDLAFSRLAKLETIAIASSSAVGIGSALLGAGVWSLVSQALAWAVVTMVLLWMSSRWRPRFIFHWSEVKTVSNYSLNLTGVNILSYFSRNADYLLIGRFLGAQELGYYTLAYRLMLYPLQNISWIANRVTFPAYSQLQSDNARFRRAYLKVAANIALITFPLMLGIMALSEPFVLAVFGSKWMPMAILLVILAPVGLYQSISTSADDIYMAKGRTDWQLRWTITSGLLFVLSFMIGLQWGVVGVAAAYAIANLILAYPTFSIPFRLIDLRVRDLGLALWRPLLSSLLMMIAVFSLRTVLLLLDIANSLTLVVLITTGIIVYLTASWMLNRAQVREILDIVGIKI